MCPPTEQSTTHRDETANPRAMWNLCVPSSTPTQMRTKQIATTTRRCGWHHGYFVACDWWFKLEFTTQNALNGDVKKMWFYGELSKTDDFWGFSRHRLCFGNEWAKLVGTTMPTIWSMVMKQLYVVIERTCPQSAADRKSLSWLRFLEQRLLVHFLIT